jgi:predicted porin
MTKVRPSVGRPRRASLVGLAVATALLAAGSTQADVTLFGEAKLSIDFDNKVPSDSGKSNTHMDSNQSKFGFKGSEDLGNGLKAIFNFAWELDPTETKSGSSSNTLADQDQWVGLQSSFGRMTFGSMATSYKASGKAVDPLYETALQAREFPGFESELHRGSGKFGGRQTNTVMYETPSFMGLHLIGHTGLDETNADNHSYGGGVHYSNGPFLAFYDYLNGNLPQVDNAVGLPQSVKQTAQKVGGKVTLGQYALFGQYEFDQGLITQARYADSHFGRFPAEGNAAAPVATGDGGDTWFVGGSAKFGNTMLVLEYGQAMKTEGHVFATGDTFTLPKSQGWVFGARHWLSKRTDVYAGYSNFNPDQGDSQDRFTVGIDHAF